MPKYTCSTCGKQKHIKRRGLVDKSGMWMENSPEDKSIGWEGWEDGEVLCPQCAYEDSERVYSDMISSLLGNK